MFKLLAIEAKSLSLVFKSCIMYLAPLILAILVTAVPRPEGAIVNSKRQFGDAIEDIIRGIEDAVSDGDKENEAITKDWQGHTIEIECITGQKPVNPDWFRKEIAGRCQKFVNADTGELNDRKYPGWMLAETWDESAPSWDQKMWFELAW